VELAEVNAAVSTFIESNTSPAKPLLKKFAPLQHRSIAARRLDY
jgi:hypothetical protein